jgi:hypothetical protein
MEMAASPELAAQAKKPRELRRGARAGTLTLVYAAVPAEVLRRGRRA